jgi:hypothetical protein
LFPHEKQLAFRRTIMKRMYYLTGNLDSTEQISNDIHAAGITDWHFHVISKDEAGLYRRRIHGAHLFQKNEAICYGERGALIGFGVALLLAIGFTMARVPFGAGASGLVYVALFGFITLFGAWVGGLMGLATENRAIARFRDDIDTGNYLILIDVRPDREEAISQLMATKHPEARLMQVAGSTLVTPFEIVRSTPA